MVKCSTRSKCRPTQILEVIFFYIYFTVLLHKDYVSIFHTVTGHRKQQIELYRRQTNTDFFFQVYSYNLRSTYKTSMHGHPHRCSTNLWAAAVTLASGQRTSIVSSYQNDASPQSRTTASHCGLANVSNEKK